MATNPVFSSFADKLLASWIPLQTAPFTLNAVSAILGGDYFPSGEQARRIEAFLLEHGCQAISFQPPYHRRPSLHYIGPNCQRDAFGLPDDARRMARRGGCFVVGKADAKGPVFLVFRRVSPKNVCLGHRRDARALLDFVRNLVSSAPKCNSKPSTAKEPA